MMLNRPQDVYQQNQVQTASPEELTLMLYNGLVKYLRQAKNAIEASQMEKAHTHMLRAQDIITEFMVTLNMEYEISQQLMLLYDFMKQQVIEANLHKDVHRLSEVENMAIELRETWMQAMKQAKTHSLNS